MVGRIAGYDMIGILVWVYMCSLVAVVSHPRLLLGQQVLCVARQAQLLAASQVSKILLHIVAHVERVPQPLSLLLALLLHFSHLASV